MAEPNENADEMEYKAIQEEAVYTPEGYVAATMEGGEDENGYFQEGYMTIPEDDPDEDHTEFVYPENYEEIANIQLRMLEEQYNAVVNGSTIPEDTLKVVKKSVYDYSKPIDVVGEEEIPREEAEKKVKEVKSEGVSKKKDPAKKKWTREEILQSFLPPDKQKKVGIKPKPSRQTKKKNEKTEKKSMKVEIKKEGKTAEMTTEKIDVIKETMKAIKMDHTPAWAKNMTEEEINVAVANAIRTIHPSE